MNPLVGLIVAIVVLANIGAALWLVWYTTRGNAKAVAGETTHIWDGDLTEYTNPLPRWWLWLFLASIAFALAYLLIYPGLGAFTGLSHWTSVSQYRAEERAAERAFTLRFESVKGVSLAVLAQDPTAMTTARNLFALNCSTCHGSDARGAVGFPNLTDSDWLHGGGEQAIFQSVAYGRNAAMPAWGPVLGQKGVDEVMAYVLTLSGRAAPSESSRAGKVRFTTFCAACHGIDGKGNQVIGAPNLTDDIWLWGGSTRAIRETIAGGRTNHMPAHLERLGEVRVRLLAAYVYGLSRQSGSAAEPAAR